MQLNAVYKCGLCGNIVEVIHVGGGTLVCCDQEMTLLEANTVDAAQEKHVPVIEKSDSSVTVKVGSVTHPMLEEHYIELIELIADGSVYRKFLNPGDEPVAVFNITAESVTAREYCNLHGLWQAEG
ncbi:desulfoferrodoxin [candidate division KSB1 bacterium]